MGIIKKVLTVLFCLIVIPAIAQCGNDWGIRLDGNNALDIQRFAEDGIGNYYFVGTFASDTLVVDTIQKLKVGGSVNDVYLAKFNHEHRALWVKQLPFDSIKYNYGSGSNIVPSNCGGYLGATFNVDNHGNIYMVSTKRNLTKYNTDGVYQWTTQLADSSGNGPMTAVSVIVFDKTGQLVAGGTCAGLTYYQPTGLNDYFLLHGDTVVAKDNTPWIAKFDTATGAVLQYRFMNDSLSIANGQMTIGEVSAIAFDNNNNMYVGGAGGYVDTSGVFITAKNGNGFFLVKFNTLWNKVWVKVGGAQLPPINSFTVQYPRQLMIGNEGSVYMLNTCNETAQIENDSLGLINDKAFVTRYDTAGNYHWSRALYEYMPGNITYGKQATELKNMGVKSNGDLLLFDPLTRSNLYKMDRNGALLFSRPLTYQVTGLTVKNDSLYIAVNDTASIYLNSLSYASNGRKDAYLLMVCDSLLFNADPVWPGDGNNDGVANNIDLLNIGLGYGTIGMVRPFHNNSWTAQNCASWYNDFATGLNYDHADCSGDGIVDANDTVAIILNYGLTHAKTYSSQRTPGAPPLYLQLVNAPVNAGDTAKFDIMLGDTVIPANNIYGLAFSVLYDSTLVQANSLKEKFFNSWLGTIDTNVLMLGHQLPNQAQLDLAISRTDHHGRSGGGPIGELSVITIDNISGKDTIINGKLIFDITGVLAIDSAGNPITIDARSDTLNIYYHDTVVDGLKDVDAVASLAIFPNPASHNINVISSQEIRSCVVYSAQGIEMMRKENIANNQMNVDVAGLAQGIYIMQVVVQGQRLNQRFTVIH